MHLYLSILQNVNTKKKPKYIEEINNNPIANKSKLN